LAQSIKWSDEDSYAIAFAPLDDTSYFQSLIEEDDSLKEHVFLGMIVVGHKPRAVTVSLISSIEYD
jgi:hypothetical protein